MAKPQLVGSPAAEVIATRDVPPEGGSDRTFELISEWILTCTKKHVECRTVFIEQGSHLPVSDPGAEDVIQDRNVPLPSRILDLCAGPQSDRIRLIDSEGLTGCYSILSHCWGKSQHLVTTTSTLADRMEDIPYSQLPKTFQDAVDITRRLGLRYLWVDSLCIIQNCYKDWEYESSMMGQAFWFAYFTIAAASAVDGNGGCLMRRTTSDSSPIKLPFYDKDGKPSGYWYVRDWPHNFDTSVVKGPLQQRCWTLQERFLSRRIIFFAKDQVYFECRESIQTEIGWPDCKLIGPDHLSLLLLHNSVQLLTDKEISKMLLQTFWYSVIEDYTGRGLTKEEDKLPALSGLASLAAKYTKVPYYAGLWKAKLVDDLLWRTARYDQKENRQARPIKQRAPSWSWASVEGSISYALLGTRKLELGHIHDAVEDAAVEVEPLGQDMYGQVRSGTVTLSGWLVRAVRGGSDSFGAGESRQWFYSRVGEWFRRQVNIQMIAMSGYE